MNDRLNNLLIELKRKGCSPSISMRGEMWRAHVNQFGNFWEDSKDPYTALISAYREWDKAGRVETPDPCG